MSAARVLVRSLAASSAGLLVLTGCGGSGTASSSAGTAGPSKGGPAVVATTTWEAALARAAGASDVRYIVPASIRHAPDYDLKPSDLAAVAGADYVLYASFEPFAARIKDAAGSKAKLVELDLDNDPATTSADVTRLGELFGTRQQAHKWNTDFSSHWKSWTQQVKAAWPGGKPPVVVAQAYATWAAKLAGARLVGSYGPNQVTPAQLAQLTARKPQFVLDNENMSTGTVLPGSGARQLDIANYPGQDLDLTTVYRTAAAQMAKAFAG